jgi:hypothetical protein
MYMYVPDYLLIISLSATKGRRVCCLLSTSHFPIHLDRLASRSSIARSPYRPLDLVSTDWCIVYSCVYGQSPSLWWEDFGHL